MLQYNFFKIIITIFIKTFENHEISRNIKTLTFMNRDIKIFL